MSYLPQNASDTSAFPASAYPIDQSKETFWRRHGVKILLAAILLISAFFRFYGRDFDQDTNQHPDERFIVGRTINVSWPNSLQQLTDVWNSPLNLRRIAIENCNDPKGCRYPYGSLPIYIERAGAWILDTISAPTTEHPKGYYLQNYQATTIVGRNLASIFDLITILIVFLIGRRLYSRSAGLIAAALTGFAVTQIQIAHFYASDTFLVTFMMGALYFSVVMMQKPSWWAAAGAGACLGLAVASKVSVAPFALIVIAAIALRAFYRRRTRKLGAEFGNPIGMTPATARERDLSFWGHFFRGLRYLLIAAVFAVIAFGVTEPYVLWQFDLSRFQNGGVQAVLESNPWWLGIEEQAAIQSGNDSADVPYTRQYIGTVPVEYHIQQMVLWGLSPLPGLIVVAGFLVGIWLAIKRRPAEILLLSGAIPYFLTILTVETKWMRYMLPLVPIFCLFGAAFLVRGVIWGRARFVPGPGRRGAFMLRLQRNTFPALVVLAVGGAFLWAVAFMNIYSQDHSRVQASQWFYDNVPAGASRSAEGWDDVLPVGLPGHDGGQYGLVAFNLYDDQPPEQEFNYIKGLLNQTDYIILASNRLYGSIPRLPWRYPVQIKFYQLLFAGKLGYIDAHTEHVTPEILGIKIDDQSADESFTVYDHPRVDIFKKVSNLTDDQLRALFATALNFPTSEYSTARHGSVTDDRSLSYDQPLNTLPDVGDYAWNPLAQVDTQWAGVLLWLLAIYLIGLAAFPFLFTILRNLPDRGYAFSRLAGLLVISWGVWWAANTRLIPFTVWSVLLMLVVLAGLSFLCWRLGAGREIKQFLVQKRNLVIFYEAIFLLAFGAFLLIRLLNPDLWQPVDGGEKPMEIGMLNAILRSPWMPPADPFFADGYINYYYQGHFMVACLIKLVGAAPSLAFNLAIPLLYSLAFSGVASVVYNIVAFSRRLRGSTRAVSRAGMVFGVLGGVLALVIGNIHGLYELLVIQFPQSSRVLFDWAQQLIGPGHNGYIEQALHTQYQTFNYWDSSRIIAHTINEFPFWTYLFADLHPHLIDMPFTIMAIGLALNLALAGRFVRDTIRGSRRTLFERVRARTFASLAWLWGPGWAGAGRFVFMAAALGVLFATNSWDYPTFMAVVGAGALVAVMAAFRPLEATAAGRPDAEEVRKAHPTLAERWTLIATVVVSVAAVAGAALLAYLPFFLSFKAFFTKIYPLIDGAPLQEGGGIMQRTTLAEYLVFWSIFVFIALSYLVYRLVRFPWQAAVADLLRFVPRSTATASLPAPQQAFQRMAKPMAVTGGLQLAHALPAGAGGSLTPATLSYVSNPDDTRAAESTVPERPTWDALHGSSSGLAAAGTAEQGGQVDVDRGSDGFEDAWHRPAANGRNGYGTGLDQAASDNWVAEAHAHTQAGVVLAAPWERSFEQPGVIPLWAGLSLLAITALLAAVQVGTGQMLLALLVALIGGIAATTLSTTRSASALFGGALLVSALFVTMGVELVYLADHLAGGDFYRMNTVFKFYVQAWILFAVGGGAAVYYITCGLLDRKAKAASGERVSPEVAELPAQAGAQPLRSLVADTSPPAPAAQPRPMLQDAGTGMLPDTDLPDHNWLIWAAEPTGPLANIENAEPATAQEDVSPSADSMRVRTSEDEPTTGGHVSGATNEQASGVDRDPRRVTWSWPRLAWLGLFALFLAACLVFPVMGTPARVNDRFPQRPPFGTLDGMAYMHTGTFDAGDFGHINLQYDYEGIQWLLNNVHGLKTLAELPADYYRSDGMRAASNTGFPMVTGAEHEGEQRASVYNRLVGDRQGDMNDFFATSDPQRVLTLISKYDIDYIYLGQLEQARAGSAGMQKFEQLADPKVGVLQRVFQSDNPQGVRGTIIYEVVRTGDKDPKTLVGAPVEGSGIPGISITPLPTATATPAPTPPVDDPELKALIADVNANPTDRDKRMKLVQWYNDHHFYAQAAEQLEIMVNQDPNNVALRHMLGDAYQAAGQPDKALKAWEDARDIDLNNPAGHNKVGIAYLERKRYDDALREFQAVVKLDEHWVEAWFHMGETYEGMGKLNEAKQAYQNVIDKSKEPNGWQDAARQKLQQLNR